VGQQIVNPELDARQRREFMRCLLDDLLALEHILENDLIETGVRRIGAEQELFLVDSHWRPAPAALKLLERLEDPRYTTELGLFNLEINLEPRVFGGRCLSILEQELLGTIEQLRRQAKEQGLDIVLTGILPTLRKSDLDLENMTPKERYHALNRAMSALRGGAYEFHIKGLDELLLKHDSVMLEACNASFQVHFQASASEFANLYNIAQVVAAPVLAAGANSPVLFGRQLWRETRIALFQQAVDTRSSMHFLRERSPRVTFGRKWVQKSALELFQEDIARFRTLVTADFASDAMATLERGDVPGLRALCLFNSTVYRWNRACYGVTDGKPHLRIENRVLPSGPTVVDQVANAAFWFGLISALVSSTEDVTRLISFEDAKMNFTAAARLGLGAQFTWFNNETLPAAGLICEKLLPMAADGLARSGVDSADVDRYLGVIERRVATSRTGAQWIVQSLGEMRDRGTMGERLAALTAATVTRQHENTPVSEWESARLEESGGWRRSYLKVEQYMTADLYTVSEEESLDLVASVMAWKRIRHVPVEDHEHKLIGLVSYRSLLELFAKQGMRGVTRPTAVAEIMKRDPITISPEVSIMDAMTLMRDEQIAALPVVKDGRLMGIITERDFMNMAAELLHEQIGRLKD
jgi:CBS domain-containing protein/gamma-glutamylcysteine synthetase